MAIDQYGSTNDSMTAGPSDARRHVNPQLGPEPWFAYPNPTPEQLDEELPPYFQQENVSLGLILERMTTKGYSELRVLLESSLPTSPLQHRPRMIIDYAKSQRQAFLKYLAILRWKAAVDVPVASSSQPPIVSAPISFPTPQTNGSNGESATTSPAGDYVGKGKARALDQDDNKPILARGKVTDAKRVTLLMEHQNHQHDEAIAHISHITIIVDTLRERNPDLLTALRLLTKGQYDRLPTSLTDPFKPVKSLSNRTILRILKRMNRHLLYRLRCVDQLPPELVIQAVRDGKVYLGSGNQYGWSAQMTAIHFGLGDDARWWLTGVEWGWKAQRKGTDDPGGVPELSADEREGLLDFVNAEVLAPKPLVAMRTEGGETIEKADAPIYRLFNFLEHLSLSYQLETLAVQALELSQGRWADQLLVNLDRKAKVLKLQYWIRYRPFQPPSQANTSNKRPQVPPQQSLGSARPPLIGGILRIALVESSDVEGRDIDRSVLQRISSTSEPSERIVNMKLNITWEVGEAGAGGSLKAGDSMDASILELDPSNLSLQRLLQTATRGHAAHLTRTLTEPLLSSPRLALFPLNLPSIIERDAEDKPLALRIPLPSKQSSSALMVSVSSFTGLIEIEDEGGTDLRINGAKVATTIVNENRTKLSENLGKLVTAVIAETIEGQMRQLGWAPFRRMALSSIDLHRSDISPATSIFVALPTSPVHYFMTNLGQQGITFELLKMARVKGDKALLNKWSVADRIPLDLVKMRNRRAERLQSNQTVMTAGISLNTSNFEVDSRDLKELFVFCKSALVAQTMVEQQLKDRSIPYTLQYPPTKGRGAAASSSAVAGMIPTICANVGDLLKEGSANDVALPPVHIQLRDWWKGNKCGAVTIVQLRHKPALASSDTATSADHEDILFDPRTSVVRFLAKDVSNCVPLFLERWERLSKVLVVAGEVTRLNKSAVFKELRVLSFDLRTVTFAYASGYNAAITYTPQDDSYQVSFDAVNGANPHEPLAGLLSHRLNELTRERVRSGQTSTGSKFISLLCNTLPLLTEVENIRTQMESPVLVYRSVHDFRLVWDVQNSKRYIVDVLLRGDKYLLIDGSVRSDPSCGPLTPIPNWSDHVAKTFDQSRKSKAESGRSGMAMKLDGGRSLLVPVDSVAEVVRSIAEAVKGSISV